MGLQSLSYLPSQTPYRVNGHHQEKHRHRMDSIMDPPNDRTTPSFKYETNPSRGVIEAVAWFQEVEPTDLPPLYQAVDPDALDALVESPKDGTRSISFEYNGCEVQVTSDRTISIHQAPHSIRGDFEPATNVLLLTPFESCHHDEACNQLLSATPSTRVNVLGVTFDPSGTKQLARWKFERVTPAEISLITVGDFTRSSAHAPDDSVLPREKIQIDSVADPNDLTTLGLRISEQLSAWESSDVQPVVCFHSLSALLHETELSRVFRFLHILTGRFSVGGAVSHFHLDPQAHDDKTIKTLRPLFDAVLEVNEDGTWSLDV